MARISEIPAFHNNSIKRLSSKSKGYFIDTGMACHLMHISSPKALAGHPRLGALFETYVVQDLLHQLTTLSTKPAIYHWRSHSGAEIDLLLEIDNQYFPIEIKCKSHPTKTDAKGIQTFISNHPQLKISPGIIIAPVESIMPLTENCFVVPFDLA